MLPTLVHAVGVLAPVDPTDAEEVHPVSERDRVPAIRGAEPDARDARGRRNAVRAAHEVAHGVVRVVTEARAPQARRATPSAALRSATPIQRKPPVVSPDAAVMLMVTVMSPRPGITEHRARAAVAPPVPYARGSTMP